MIRVEIQTESRLMVTHVVADQVWQVFSTSEELCILIGFLKIKQSASDIAQLFLLYYPTEYGESDICGKQIITSSPSPQFSMCQDVFGTAQNHQGRASILFTRSRTM
ncbi:hypothetical protein AVEN_252006-1 [Araneus ventricosus]|uniref:Uncharacterized protein n=1 Tax=Araneus ventricosus TaxID=182803 RepID=A0A4Y2CF22_ARAVE|nr:hypothetical protein AVEN_236181-1 [Araneus ventricosus]GBM02544.1 hypothetical protein AVEN_252006-1 [Araneus ventricosus]